MALSFTSRPYNPAELRLLSALKSRLEKVKGGKLKYYHFPIAALLGAGFTWISTRVPDGFWTFLSGTLAVLCFGFLVFTPYEVYKVKRRNKVKLKRFIAAIEKGSVSVCPVQASRIALAREFEDEGDLYLVEYEKGNVLFFWDLQHNLHKRKFPCLHFEIYEEDFFTLTGLAIRPLSERIAPVLIDQKAKWNYMKKYGVPAQLETAETDFDSLTDQFKACLKDH